MGETVNVADGFADGAAGAGGAGTAFLWQAPSSRVADRTRDKPANRRKRALIHSSLGEAEELKSTIGQKRERSENSENLAAEGEKLRIVVRGDDWQHQ
jgi:hypothetical protein